MKKLTNEQVALLKMKVMFSEDVKSDMARKTILWLIDQTQNMKRNVIVNLQNGENDYGDLAQDVAYSIHDMNSCACTTDLHGFKKKNGLKNVWFTGGGGSEGRYYAGIHWEHPTIDAEEAVLIKPDLDSIATMPLTFLGEEVTSNKKPPKQYKAPTSWSDFDASAEKPAGIKTPQVA